MTETWKLPLRRRYHGSSPQYGHSLLFGIFQVLICTTPLLAPRLIRLSLENSVAGSYNESWDSESNKLTILTLCSAVCSFNGSQLQLVKVFFQRVLRLTSVITLTPPPQYFPSNRWFLPWYTGGSYKASVRALSADRPERRLVRSIALTFTLGFILTNIR